MYEEIDREEDYDESKGMDVTRTRSFRSIFLPAVTINSQGVGFECTADGTFVEEWPSASGPVR
jgi:hypothetical protein